MYLQIHLDFKGTMYLLLLWEFDYDNNQNAPFRNIIT